MASKSIIRIYGATPHRPMDITEALDVFARGEADKLALITEIGVTMGATKLAELIQEVLAKDETLYRGLVDAKKNGGLIACIASVGDKKRTLFSLDGLVGQAAAKTS